MTLRNANKSAAGFDDDKKYREELLRYKNLPHPYPGVGPGDSPGEFWTN